MESTRDSNPDGNDKVFDIQWIVVDTSSEEHTAISIPVDQYRNKDSIVDDQGDNDTLSVESKASRNSSSEEDSNNCILGNLRDKDKRFLARYTRFSLYAVVSLFYVAIQNSRGQWYPAMVHTSSTKWGNIILANAFFSLLLVLQKHAKKLVSKVSKGEKKKKFVSRGLWKPSSKSDGNENTTLVQGERTTSRSLFQNSTKAFHFYLQWSLWCVFVLIIYASLVSNDPWDQIPYAKTIVQNAIVAVSIGWYQHTLKFVTRFATKIVYTTIVWALLVLVMGWWKPVWVVAKVILNTYPYVQPITQIVLDEDNNMVECELTTGWEEIDWSIAELDLLE